MADYIYDAFISYSHRDMKWARWLQKKLETFRIPASLTEADAEMQEKSEKEELPLRILPMEDDPEDAEQGDPSSDGADPVREGEAAAADKGILSSGRKTLRVFRDQTDLAGTDLQTTLEKELEASRFLIVICSPASAMSGWVDEEIRYFQSIGRADSVIPFIVEGEPESRNPEIECYPLALRDRKDRHTLGANVQEIGRNKAFLKLVSIMLNVRFNRLVDRDKVRRRRTVLITSAVAAVTAVIILGLLLNNRSIAKKNQKLSYDAYVSVVLSLTKDMELNSDSIELLKLSADAGNVDAMVFLADCYKNGNGTEKDLKAAFDLYKKGAEAGDTVCMLALANCYYNGAGTEVDLEKSFSWDLMAAEAGDVNGMFETAASYEGGFGTEKDEKTALSWYHKAADAGYDLAMYNLARCYNFGIGTEVNLEQAFFWMEKLAETGNAFGMYNVGLMYQYGRGTKEDPVKAAQWYRKAADTGDADGAYMMGWCVENNYGITDAALEWYERAAELGSAEAAEAVARLQAQADAG